MQWLPTKKKLSLFAFSVLPLLTQEWSWGFTRRMNTKKSFRAPNAAGLATPQILCTIIETMSAGLKELFDAGKYTLLTSDQWVYWCQHYNNIHSKHCKNCQCCPCRSSFKVHCEYWDCHQKLSSNSVIKNCHQKSLRILYGSVFSTMCSSHWQGHLLS